MRIAEFVLEHLAEHGPSTVPAMAAAAAPRAAEYGLALDSNCRLALAELERDGLVERRGRAVSATHADGSPAGGRHPWIWALPRRVQGGAGAQAEGAAA